MTIARQASSLVRYKGNYNAVINGGMDIWQRGTSFSSAASGTYAADRWIFYFVSSTGVFNITRQTDVPTVAQAGRLFNYSYQVAIGTNDTSIAAGEYAFIRQTIEGQNFLPLAQIPFTISFWVKAYTTGTYCVSMRNSGSDRSYVAEYTINSSATWEYKTITVPPSPAGGTWDYTTGAGLKLDFVLAAGSTFQTTAGSWKTGNYFGTSNQVNGLNSSSNYMKITGVQVEPGRVATPFSTRTIEEETLLCLRYYNGGLAGWVGGGATPAATNRTFYCTVIFPVTMRIAPTCSKSGESLSNMNAGTISNITTTRALYYATNSVTNDCAASTTIIADAEY